MRILEIHRKVDESGVSGTGHVLDAVEFDDGTVVVRWRSDKPSTSIYNSYPDFFNVHISPHPDNLTEIRVLFDSKKWKTISLSLADSPAVYRSFNRLLPASQRNIPRGPSKGI